jgi:acyl dehydratase
MEPAMSSERYWEDFAVGQTFESGTVMLTTDEIIAFASQFDPQPFHTNPAAAEGTFFGGLVASGWHTAAVTMRLLVQSDLRVAGGLVGGGLDEVRWPKPVWPGDTLHVGLEVVETRPLKSRPERGIVRIKVQTFNQNNEPVQSFIANVLVPRRR